MATVTVTDEADGTVTWAISDAAGLDWTIYRAQWNGAVAGSWTSVATGTGNSDETHANDAGYWLTYVVIDAVPTTVRYYRATDGEDAAFKQILDAVLSRIKSLSLTDIADASIVLRKRPWDRNITKPAIIVAPAPETRDHQGGSNLLDETGYGCLVAIWAVSNQDLTSDFNRHLQWRQDVTRAFQNQSDALTTVVTVTSTHVEPGSVVLPDEFASGYDVQSLVIRVFAREPRGV